MKTLPDSRVYYDAKVIGFEVPDGSFQPLRVGRLGLPIRTWDSLIVYRKEGSDEIVRAEPVAFKPTSPKQTEGVDAALRARKGRLIVVATDPEHQTVISLRIDPRVLAQTRFIACEDLGGGAVSGTWRAFSSTGNGLVIEAHPGMEFSIIVRPRAVDITGSMAGGPVRVSDVDYAVTTRALGFSYHTPNPFGGELSSHVRLTETEPGLFEGEEIGGWTGATARPFSLRWHHL